jgi:outer membrane protein TolC
MKKLKFLILGALIIQFSASAQKLTLRQCIDYASANNGNIKIAAYNTDIAQKKVEEAIGAGLPQITGTGTLTDNLKIATSLMPGAIFGKPGTFVAIQTGVKYNVNAALALTQKIYDPSFLLALEASKISKLYTDQSLRKTNESTVYSVSKTYYQTLVIGKQRSTLQATLDASEKTLASTDLKYRNGAAKKIDVDKIRVSYNNTKSQLEQSDLSYKQSLNNLKYAMGMPVDADVALADTNIDDQEASKYSPANEDYIENRVDYQLQKTNLLVDQIAKRKSFSEFLPSLSFTASYNYQAMRQEFNFFDSEHWYPGANIGLTLSIPIFDGFQKVSRLNQSEINIKIAEQNLKLTEQAIKVDASNYEIQYRNALDNIKTEKDNLTLAEEVYKNTQIDYQHGAGTSLDLVQAESSLREAQNNYFSKLLNLYIARLDLEQSRGSLMNYINNLK